MNALTRLGSVDREAAEREAIQLTLIEKPLVPAFGADRHGRRWVVCVRTISVEAAVSEIRRVADLWRDGCGDPVLSPNRIEWAAAADAWLAGAGEVCAAVYWRATDLIVPHSVAE